MSEKKIIALMCVGLVIWLLAPTEVFASTTQAFGGQEILKIGEKLKSFMFDTIIPFTGGIFGGVHTVRSLASNDYQAIGKFGILTARALIVPPFLNSVLGSSMLLP